MSNQPIHCEALGYEPFRMKPVHFAAGLFLSLAELRYDLELLNKVAVIKNNKGLLDDYTHEQLRERLVEQRVVDGSVTVDDIKLLRVQVNGVVGNDDAVYGAFRPYKKPPGVAYTLVSNRYIFDKEPLDGCSGYFIQRVLGMTAEGTEVLDFLRQRLASHSSTLELLVAPLLDDAETCDPFRIEYESRFGTLPKGRLRTVAGAMAKQTRAIAALCRNLENQACHSTQLRQIVLGLCSWLFVYLHRVAAEAHGLTRDPLFVSDFVGNANERLRAASRLSFARQRGLVFECYKALRERGRIDFNDGDFAKGKEKKGPPDFKFLEEHYSDLAVRIGFAQPRAFQARRKHFELQPDTARLLTLSVIEPSQPVLTIEELAAKLRDVWGICFGGCEDDLTVLRRFGHEGLDEDADLQPNCQAFVGLLKRLNLAVEPSDGLILCAARPEELP